MRTEIYALLIFLTLLGCQTPSSKSNHQGENHSQIQKEKRAKEDKVNQKEKDPLPKKEDKKEDKPVRSPREKVNFHLLSSPKDQTLQPSFQWRIPKDWKVSSILFNLYLKEEYERGGKPELVIFDLKDHRRLDLKEKSSELKYYGKLGADLQLLPQTTYTAVLVIRGDPKSLVAKVEFTTSTRK